MNQGAGSASQALAASAILLKLAKHQSLSRRYLNAWNAGESPTLTDHTEAGYEGTIVESITQQCAV
jgi:hypothetical protein